MRRPFHRLIGLIPLIAAAACGSTAGNVTLTTGRQGHTYRDTAGWTVEVPAGWHAVRFSDAKDGITSAGVQLSNVRLPPPTLVPGFPIQVNRGVLPERGIGLIIATDTDRKLPRGSEAVPPLPAPQDPDGWKYWNAGSASAGVPSIQTLWFRVKDATFIACAKIGSKSTSRGLQAIAAIIRSLR
jgi:hypothetical protein